MRFPNLAVEKEFAQATGRADTAGKTDRATLHAVLSKRENRYLVRQLCWVLTIQGLDTYILVPRDPADADLLVEALRPAPEPERRRRRHRSARSRRAARRCATGSRCPSSSSTRSTRSSRDALVEAIPRPEKTPRSSSAQAAAEVFDRILQLTDNAGATDEHRALNYLAVRYPGMYAKAAWSSSTATSP